MNRNGVKGCNAKVDEAQVLKIRQLHERGITCANLGRRFGLSTRAVYCIVERKTWTHVKDGDNGSGQVA